MSKVLPLAAPGLTTFVVQKKTVRVMLHALTGTQPNQFQPSGAPGLQDRPGISGKLARRMAANRRALARADDQITAERKALVRAHAERFPATQDDGTPHPRAGEPTPVFATDQAGQPIFEKADGKDTTTRVAMPDEYNLANPAAFQVAFTALLDQYIAVECVGFTDADFDLPAHPTFPLGKMVDALDDITQGSESNATVADQAAALDARAAFLTAEAQRLRDTLAL